MRFLIHLTGQVVLVLSLSASLAWAQLPLSEPQAVTTAPLQDPFEPDDFTRLLGVQGKSSVIASLLLRFNQELQMINTATDSRASAYRDFAKKVSSKPGAHEFFSYPSVTFGLNLNASRVVTTGIYGGTLMPVQLLDTLSLSASLGAFYTFENVGSAFPKISELGANVSVVRDYTHSRPIPSMKNAKDVPWKDVLVPSYLQELTSVLEMAEKSGEGEITSRALETFLSQLQDGEIINITDSLATTASLKSSSTLSRLLSLQAFPFFTSFSVGADANQVVIRQVSMHRVNRGNFNGIHIYLRSIRNRNAGLEMNSSFFINLLRVRAQNQKSDVKTDAFLIPAFDVTTGKISSRMQADLPVVLLPLLREAKSAEAYSRFPDFQLQAKHNLKEKDLKIRILPLRFSTYKEDHWLDLKFAKEITQDEARLKSVSLFRSKRGTLQGRDFMNFGFDVADGVIRDEELNQDVRIARGGGRGDNPANQPFGKASWRQVVTESDISEQNSAQFPTVALLQRVWGGWKISGDKLRSQVQEIESQLEGVGIHRGDLIPEQELKSVVEVDFYRIIATLTVFEGGLQKIRDLLLQPQTAGHLEPHPLYKLVSKIRCRGSQNSECGASQRLANDREFVLALQNLLADGDLETGKRKYQELCESEKNRGTGNYPTSPTSVVHRGGTYDCLTSWTAKLIDLSYRFPAEKAGQIRWMTQVLYTLDEHVPVAQLLKFLGPENYQYSVKISGFRVGSEIQGLDYLSKPLGIPGKDSKYASGLYNYVQKQSGLRGAEVERTLTGVE